MIIPMMVWKSHDFFFRTIHDVNWQFVEATNQDEVLSGDDDRLAWMRSACIRANASRVELRVFKHSITLIGVLAPSGNRPV